MGKQGRASVCKTCRTTSNRNLRDTYADRSPVTEKVCPRCKKLLPAEAFRPEKSKRGLGSYCRECERTRRREAYAADPERWKREAAKWAKQNPERQRAASRAWTLRTKYGISVQDYERLLAEQQGGCAICHTDDPGRVRGGQLTIFRVDHCHETGRIRGLLCNACNTGIGLLGDDPDRLAAASAYLRQCREGADTPT